MDDNTKTIMRVFAYFGVIGLLGFMGLLIAFPVKWTWNVIMPYLFSLPTLTWGKAWCLYFLSGCLVKSIHVHK